MFILCIATNLVKQLRNIDGLRPLFVTRINFNPSMEKMKLVICFQTSMAAFKVW